MDDGEGAIAPEREQRRQRRMKREEAVEVDGAFTLAVTRRLDGDARPDRRIGHVTVGRHHAEAIDRAALEDGDQDLAPAGRRFHCA